MMIQNQYVIIVAGGQGVRMNSDTPKQFMIVNNLPVIMHSMMAFYRYNPFCKQIIVLPEKQLSVWMDLTSKHPLPFSFSIANGGETRFHSVKSGLELIKNSEGIVSVHDAVRMLVSNNIISSAYTKANEFGSAIPCVPLKDSVRRIKNDTNNFIDRNDLVRIQTPQAFHVSILKEAYQQPYQSFFTDDASVVETRGLKLHLFEGEESNIKITEPIDLIVADAILKSRNPSPFPF